MPAKPTAKAPSAKAPIARRGAAAKRPRTGAVTTAKKPRVAVPSTRTSAHTPSPTSSRTSAHTPSPTSPRTSTRTSLPTSPRTSARTASRSAAPTSARASARGTLSRERIAAQALALIDRDGVEAMSLRTLAAELGCEAMSLYRHVANKDDLLDAVVDELVAEWVVPPEQARQGVAPRERYERLCASYRAIARRHPLAFPLLAARRFNSAASLEALERVLSVLKDAGLDAPARARAFRMTGYFLNGMGLAEGAVLATGPLRQRAVLVDAAPQDFPVTRETAPWLGPDGLDGAYEQGMNALMAAIFSAASAKGRTVRR